MVMTVPRSWLLLWVGRKILPCEIPWARQQVQQHAISNFTLVATVVSTVQQHDVTLVTAVVSTVQQVSN